MHPGGIIQSRGAVVVPLGTFGKDITRYQRLLKKRGEDSWSNQGNFAAHLADMFSKRALPPHPNARAAESVCSFSSKESAREKNSSPVPVPAGEVSDEATVDRSVFSRQIETKEGDRLARDLSPAAASRNVFTCFTSPLRMTTSRQRSSSMCTWVVQTIMSPNLC